MDNTNGTKEEKEKEEKEKKKKERRERKKKKRKRKRRKKKEKPHGPSNDFALSSEKKKRQTGVRPYPDHHQWHVLRSAWRRIASATNENRFTDHADSVDSLLFLSLSLAFSFIHLILLNERVSKHPVAIFPPLLINQIKKEEEESANQRFSSCCGVLGRGTFSPFSSIFFNQISPSLSFDF